MQTFCHSVSRKNWKHLIDPSRNGIIAFMILSGNQTVVSPDGSRREIGPGYFMAADLKTVQEAYITSSPRAERYFILLEKNSFLSKVLEEFFPGGLPAFQLPEPEILQKCFQDIRREILRRHVSDARIGAAAYRLLYEVSGQYPAEDQPPPLRLARNYIADHFHQAHLCREEIARVSCVSVSTLAGLFRKHLGKTIWEYISEQRMEKVRQLLIYSNKPIGEIAGECGFSYAYYLTREFRSNYGMTPSAYRKQNRKSN